MPPTPLPSLVRPEPPPRELVNQVDTLCSKLEIRVGTTDVATAQPDGERMIALLNSVLSDAWVQDVNTPTGGVG